MSPKESIYQRLPFYYGWLVFLATFLTLMFMFGLRYSIGVFFVPIQKEFGWSSAVTAGSLTVFFWVYGVFALFISKLYKSIGIRKIILLGGIFLGLGGIIASFTTELWQLYLSWGVLAAIGSSILYTVPNMVLGRFFLKNRGKAVGWSSIGISVGQAVIIPFSAWIVANYGWRYSFLLLGTFVIIGVALPGYLIFRDSPESIGLKKDGGKFISDEKEQSEKIEKSSYKVLTLSEILKTRTFRYILVSYFFQVGGTVSLLTFVVPHIIQLGIDPLLAASAIGVIGIMSAIGSFVFGFISDWIGRKYTIAIALTGMATAMLVSTIIPPNIIALYAWVTLYGLTYGGAPEQYASIVQDYYGTGGDVALYGWVMFFGALGGGLFPLISGYLFDITGNYYASLIFLGVGVVGGLASMLLVKPPKKIETV